jgi:hypothetical protein
MIAADNNHICMQRQKSRHERIHFDHAYPRV